MKTLEVTDEQYAFIQYLREEISESVVGKYGFVRERDAVQFLVDNLDEDIEIDADEFDSSATDDVAASVGAAIDGETDPHDLEEVFLRRRRDAGGRRNRGRGQRRPGPSRTKRPTGTPTMDRPTTERAR